MVRRDLAMAAKKAKGDDWFSSLDAELEKKTKEIIEDVGEQNVARLELNKTLIEDFWKVWKRFNKINVHFALEPSYTNWAVFPDTFPDGDWHWRPVSIRPRSRRSSCSTDRWTKAASGTPSR